MMVYLVHKLTESQSPQPPHLPGAEGLVEASVENLFDIAVVLIVQIIHYHKEITGAVPDVSPPLTQEQVLDDPDHLIFKGAPATGRWEEEDAHCIKMPKSPLLLASLYCQG